VFIPLFVLGVFIFGFSIWLLATRLYEKLPQKTFLIGALIIIGGIVAGVVMMFQPFALKLFSIGFWFVLVSLIAFMYWSHIEPRTRPVMAAKTTEGSTAEPGALDETAAER
jgi:type IV secretory pathway TrbD component